MVKNDFTGETITLLTRQSFKYIYIYIFKVEGCIELRFFITLPMKKQSSDRSGHFNFPFGQMGEFTEII